MKLNIHQIRDCARGAARVEQVGENIALRRFTAQQEEMYKNRDKDFYSKTFATAGVNLVFTTDSPTLGLSVDITRRSSRNYYGLTVFADGRVVGRLDGQVESVGATVNRTGSFCLGEGVKQVKILLPWSAAALLRYVELAPGSSFVPVKAERTMLIFGDSITQGYDAVHPENAYAYRLAEYFKADARNKAIGGEVFWPELALAADDMEPEVISVAYGTNDWSKTDHQTLTDNSRAFFHNLRACYPSARILVLAPIWRADKDLEKPAGQFSWVAEHLKTVAGEVGGQFISCYDFVPKEPAMFADLRLHPNDEGFEHYADNLLKTLKTGE